MADNATHALASSATAKPTLSVEEEVIVIRNGWTPKKYYISNEIKSNVLFYFPSKKKQKKTKQQQ